MRQALCGTHHQLHLADGILRASDKQSRYLDFLQFFTESFFGLKSHQRPAVVYGLFSWIRCLTVITDMVCSYLTPQNSCGIVVYLGIEGRRTFDDTLLKHLPV